MIREQMKKNIDIITNSLKYSVLKSVLKRLLIAIIPIIGVLANDYSEAPDLIGIISLFSTISVILFITAILLF